MRKIIIIGGIVAVAALAAVWSMSTLATPKDTGKVQAASAPISPHDIMVKQGKDVQIEYWAHPF
jgi:Rieske Fe-S protein